jgi:hypothetical protein
MFLGENATFVQTLLKIAGGFDVNVIPCLLPGSVTLHSFIVCMTFP